MAAVRRELGLNPDTWIMPSFPVRQVGVFYFVRASVSANQRANVLRHHGEANVCGKAGPQFYWEQEVYEDTEGERWIIDPLAKSQALNGWRPSTPCPRCADRGISAILAERSSWQEQGACFGTEAPELMENRMTETVRRTCGGCPVRLICRNYGRRLHRATPDGIKGVYGGETEGQRNAYQSA